MPGHARDGSSVSEAMRRPATAVLWAAAIAILAYRRRALTLDGAIAAAGVGGVVLWRGGLPAAAALNVFFATSSVLSRLGERRKARGGALAQAKGARRDAWQVLANGGIAAGVLARGGRLADAAFVGALAAAAADTWATEIGLLSRHAPRLITTGREVAPGTSGAVTALGLLAATAGALTVGATWSLVARAGTDARAPLPSVVVAGVAGVAGSLADSLLGATLQASYWCATCEVRTESARHGRCGRIGRLRTGQPWMTNDTVNALAAACGAATAALVCGVWSPARTALP